MISPKLLKEAQNRPISCSVRGPSDKSNCLFSLKGVNDLLSNIFFINVFAICTRCAVFRSKFSALLSHSTWIVLVVSLSQLS